MVDLPSKRWWISIVFGMFTIVVCYSNSQIILRLQSSLPRKSLASLHVTFSYHGNPPEPEPFFVDSHPFIYIIIYIYIYSYPPWPWLQITATKWYVHYTLYHTRTTRLQWNNGIQNCSWISPVYNPHKNDLINIVYINRLPAKMASIPFCSSKKISHTSVSMALI